MTGMWLVLLCALLLTFACVSVGDNNDDVFIFPTAPGPSNNFVADLTWPLGSTQKIQWTTIVDGYYIALFQQSIDPPSGLPLETIYSTDYGGTGQQSFSWQVQTYNANQTLSPVYFLWLLPGDPQGFTSHYFNITNKAQSSSSSSSSTAFISSIFSTTSVIESSTLNASPQSTSSTAPASPSSVSASTETAKVGLGVGLGIGVPMVLIAGIWIGLQSVKQRKASLHGMGSELPLSRYPNSEPILDDSYPPSKDSTDHANKTHGAPTKLHEYHEAPTNSALTELG